MNSVDKLIIEWFNTDFGLGFSGGIVGNLCLILLSFVMTLLLSGLIGFEREYHGHSAGLRTHVLIAIGACAIMVLSIYGFGYWDSIYLENGASRDPSRLAAQAITGIGFLGAGTIIQTGMNIKGLTTAATIWVAMGIGLACGCGSFLVAILVAVLSFFVLIGLNRLEAFAAKKNPFLVIVVPQNQAILGMLLPIAKRLGLTVEETISEMTVYQETIALRVIVKCGRVRPEVLSAFVDEIRASIHPLGLRVNNVEAF